MISGTWRGMLGGSLALSLLVAPIVMAHAETSPATPATSSSSAATNPGKPAAKSGADTANAAKPTAKPAKIATKPAAPHPAAKLADAKKTPEPAKKIVAAKKPETAKSEPTKTATAEAKPAPASYTITSTRGGVTTTTTRVVPSAPAMTTAAVPAAPASPVETKPAAAAAKPQAPVVPVSPVETKPATAAAAKPEAPAAPVSPIETKPATVAAAKPEAPAATQVASAAPAKPASFAAVAATAVAPASAKLEAPAVHLMPSDPKAAAAFVSNFLVEAFHLAKANGTSLQRRAQLADLFAGKMDMPRIAVYTTADELNGASSDIQQQFRTILVSYLVETYYPQLELASDPSVKVETVAAEPLNDGTAVVWTTFTKDGWGSQSVKWHLQNEDGHYRIVDIFTAGASLVQMERDTFQSVMRNGGLNELMAKLDARTKQLATAATE
jgi:ABC-type transporter MlaC component